MTNVRKKMIKTELFSVRYKVLETHCLTAGIGKGRTTNVRLRVMKPDLKGRWVGVHSLDLVGDQSWLAGKELLLTVEEVGEENEEI